jgi:hypothetical protein
VRPYLVLKAPWIEPKEIVMFSTPQHGKGIFMKKIFSLVFALVMGALLLSGCNSDDPKAWLPNTWTNVSGAYTTIITITPTTISYSDSYEGTIANTPDFGASDGILIIKFTKYADWSSGSAVLSDSHANVDKYGALYWKELTPTSVSMSDAYKKINETDEYPSHTMFNDLETAKTNFTRDNEGMYINWSITSPYHN